VAFILGPLFGTKVLEDFGPTILWAGTSLLGVITAVMMLKMKRKTG